MISSDQPLVSFVVLCFNFEEYIGACLESIRELDGDFPFEVIVVDDASTDRSLHVIEEFTSDPRFRVIRQPLNRGHADSVGVGIREARGRFVARIDGDDRYHSNFLRDTVPVLLDHDEVGLVHGLHTVIGPSPGDRGASDVPGGGGVTIGWSLVPLLKKNFVCAPTVLARARLWNDCLPVPEDLPFHDWWFTVGIARKAQFAYVNRVLSDYRVHARNLHRELVRSRREEPGVFWLLDWVFSEREQMQFLDDEKRRARREIYASHYLDFAGKYFGQGYEDDARRCLGRAVALAPSLFLNGRELRLLCAAFIGKDNYDQIKSMLVS